MESAFDDDNIGLLFSLFLSPPFLNQSHIKTIDQ